MIDRKISVVIPSYNYAKFLPEAVACVARQTYKNIELVIIDDCSTDNSEEVIVFLRQQYENAFAGGFVFLKNDTNMGAHATINAGIKISSGELISILNADDLYEENRFEVLVNVMGKSKFAFSSIKCIDENGEILHSEQADAFCAIQNKIEGKDFMALSAVAENVTVSTGNMLFYKSLFEEIGGFCPYKYVHDYEFFWKACLLCEPVYTNKTNYLYRLHGNNSFTQLKKEGLLENRLLWLDFYASIKKGEVRNAYMTRQLDYKEKFYDEVAREGKKKLLLWKLCLNPIVVLIKKLVKKVKY